MRQFLGNRLDVVLDRELQVDLGIAIRVRDDVDVGDVGLVSGQHLRQAGQDPGLIGNGRQEGEGGHSRCLTSGSISNHPAALDIEADVAERQPRLISQFLHKCEEPRGIIDIADEPE